MVLNALLNYRIVAYISDTVPSFYSRISTFDLLKEIKKRKEDKPFIFLCSDFSMVQRIVCASQEMDLIKKEFENRVGESLIVKANINIIPKKLTLNDTIAIRIPNSSEVKEVIKTVNEPILSTSVRSKDQYIKDDRVTYIKGWKRYTRQKASPIYSLIYNKYIRE